jgi:hypothetical protein
MLLDLRSLFESAGATQTISAAGGIASGEAFGTATLNLAILPVAIGTGEQLGTAKLNLQLLAAAITSAEAVGQPKLNLQITAAGAIPSAEAFGSDVVDQDLLAVAIQSQEVFGLASVITPLSIVAFGIPSAEAFGTPEVPAPYLVQAHRRVEATFYTPWPQELAHAGAVPSEEAVGIPTLFVHPPAQAVVVPAIEPEEIWQQPALFQDLPDEVLFRWMGMDLGVEDDDTVGV